MATLWTVIVWILGSLVFSANGEASVEAYAEPSGPYFPGQSIIMHCKVTGDTTKFCTWNPPNGSPFEPSSFPNFYESVSSGSTAECTFRIKSASDFESGKWTCNPFLSGGDSKKSDPIDILVARPPESIEVSEVRKDAYHEILQAQNAVNFTCEVKAIRPEVESIQWYIVREDGSEEHLTPSQPGLLHSNKTFVSADFSSYPGMQNQGVQQMMVYNVNATLSHVFSPLDNGRKLVCRVTHMLLHPANNSASAKLEVQYVPVVHMDDWKTKNFDPHGNKFYLPPGTKGEITVYFLANPPISAPQREVQWIIRNDITLNSGQEEGKVKAGPVTHVPGARNDLYETTLTIDPVGREDATDGYILRLYSSPVSPNAQEPFTEFKFRVELGDRPPAAGMDAGVIAGVVIAVIALAIVIILVVIARVKGLFCFAAPEGRKEGSETESADRAPAHGKGGKPLASRLSDLYNRVTNPKKEKKKDMADVEAAKKEEVPLTEKEKEKHGESEGEEEEKKEKEGVVYAELDLKESGKKLPPKKTSHGESTEYVEIVGTVPPPPSYSEPPK